MVNVAIAGGLGNFGRTVTEVLSLEGKHQVFALGREVIPPHPPVNLQVPFIAVDYNHVQHLQALLQDNEIHVVISCLSLTDDSAIAAETNLILAADNSAVTTRFITSNWGTPYMPWLKYKLAAIDQLKSTNLEWTYFTVGYFLDYYGMPHVKTHLPTFLVAVDVANKIARIPGTGNDPVTFTYTYDVARFVAVALDMKKWEEETIVAGDKATWNEFLKLAQEIRRCWFDVEYDSIEKLQASQITELPSHVSSYGLYPKELMQFLMAGLERAMVAGKLNLPDERALNRLHPDIKMVKIEDMLRENWRRA
ncbi:uncharacterized protein NECHADRAFT_44399 [Fusarium vanettenii 77-13-4]|uniref:NmrA-like domain-containing protein n=1 Tax=Fusarium vanettenii (strain ATCC MYA-4622 / CBS 123669 / FGSC 9596 / NRRL 45880 / 77-13-4) TaxID=660122 RepID=C7ZJQ5_FUSV7|nr:uncharacterized protein NECHADRAFT_44399 [Fusarium vanettenii 77-13-4]EEU35743.1 hypothetical protein NECHADRAFT_44399 [Fusarium vanettenii 77-13-4]